MEWKPQKISFQTDGEYYVLHMHGAIYPLAVACGRNGKQRKQNSNMVPFHV